jgi:hypothetical protein
MSSDILTIKWFATANLLNVSIYAGKWLAPVLTSYASSRADVANPRSQTMNIWINDPTFIVGDHFVLRIVTIRSKILRRKPKSQ